MLKSFQNFQPKKKNTLKIQYGKYECKKLTIMGGGQPPTAIEFGGSSGGLFSWQVSGVRPPHDGSPAPVAP